MFSWDDPKTMSNLIIGPIILALGLIPLLSSWGLIGFSLPSFLNNVIGYIAIYVIAGLGIWLLIDAFLETDHIQTITFIIAFSALVLGIIPILVKFGVLAWTLPSFFNITLYYIFFTLEGLFLIIAAFATY